MQGKDAGPVSKTVLTIASWLATNSTQYLPTPHEILVLDSETGEPLEPEIRLRSQLGSGRVLLALPSGLVPSLHVLGTGATASDAHDSITLNFVAEDSDGLLRVTNHGVTQIAYKTAEVSALAERAALWGSIGWRAKRARQAPSIGCAKVFLDDAVGADASSDQRYISAAGLPVSLSVQDATPIGGLRSFYFGNIATGPHTLRVSLDDGASFIAEASFVISRARADAQGPTPEMAYDLAIEVDSDRDPTPASCHYD